MASDRMIYIPNKGAHDYTMAKNFGTIIFCTEGILNKYNTSQMFRALDEAMQDSQPDDYILITSLTTLCSIACSIFVHKHGRLNLLIFMGGNYIERNIVFN